MINGKRVNYYMTDEDLAKVDFIANMYGLSKTAAVKLSVSKYYQEIKTLELMNSEQFKLVLEKLNNEENNNK